MTDTEEPAALSAEDGAVLTWATKYCSDMGAGPTRGEQVCIDAVRTKLEAFDAQADEVARLRAAL